MRRNNAMFGATIIMGILAVALVAFGWYRGEGQHVSGMRSALETTLQILPLLFFAFIVAGMVQVLIPPEAVSRWVGEESGMRGIIIGSVAGTLTPGGPYVSYPVAAGLMTAGASVGTLVAFVTGWAILGVAKIPMEIGIMGWKFTAIRMAAGVVFPPLSGIIAQALFSGKSLTG